MSDENATSSPPGFRDLVKSLTRPLRDLFNEPLPEGVSFFHTTGSLCLFMAGIQVLTGVLMAFYYTPSPEVAWESVRYVDEKVSFGNIIHGLHHWGSSGFVVAIFIHLMRVFAFGAGDKASVNEPITAFARVFGNLPDYGRLKRRVFLAAADPPSLPLWPNRRMGC